ncbi:hypothetical protein [Pseudonocardia sp.]|uniref:hypothetical protein n=1 Tax=Pseudonocardia sp. TaxID=60912 RepID=UPI002621A1BF|nr:hypothetical protein [Pseudonocardia sp.]
MPVPAESLPDAGFDVARRGYDQGQVDSHLRRIDAEIAILTADRNAAVDQAAQLARELDDARERAEKLRAQVRTLAGPPQSVQGMSERMRSMLRLAEDEVAEMLGRAETEAAQRRQEAEQEAAQIVAAAQEEAAAFLGPAQLEATELAERTVRERAQIGQDRITMERKLAADRAELDRELAERRAEAERCLADERATVEALLEGQRAELEREITERLRRSEQERAVVEEDFAIAMDQRRSEALRELHAERDATRREIEQMREETAARTSEQVTEAEDRARRMIADAEHRVAELGNVRGRVAEQLDAARNALGRVIGSLEPVPGEPGAAVNGHPAGAEPATVRLNPDTLTDSEPVAVDRARPTPRQRTRATAGRR